MMANTVWGGAVVALLCMMPHQQDSSACLQRLEGRWTGTGTSYGQPVRDAATFEWTMGRRFLRVTYHAEAGDSFAAEGYFWQNPADGRVSFYEFSTGARPIRVLSGTCGLDELRLDEQDSERHVRLTFRFVDTATIEMTEADLRGEHPAILVKEELKKAAP